MELSPANRELTRIHPRFDLNKVEPPVAVRQLKQAFQIPEHDVTEIYKGAARPPHMVEEMRRLQHELQTPPGASHSINILA